jgi:hypothetical protein
MPLRWISLSESVKHHCSLVYRSTGAIDLRWDWRNLRPGSLLLHQLPLLSYSVSVRAAKPKISLTSVSKVKPLFQKQFSSTDIIRVGLDNGVQFRDQVCRHNPPVKLLGRQAQSDSRYHSCQPRKPDGLLSPSSCMYSTYVCMYVPVLLAVRPPSLKAAGPTARAGRSLQRHPSEPNPPCQHTDRDWCLNAATCRLLMPPAKLWRPRFDRNLVTETVITGVCRPAQRATASAT